MPKFQLPKYTGAVLLMQNRVNFQKPLSTIIYAPHFFITSGPGLEDALWGHSMVPLGLGQAIIGGKTNGEYTTTIYHLECSQKSCDFTKLGAELTTARGSFVAIPMPDFLSGCRTEGKQYL